MRRLTLVLVIILMVAIIGGGTWWVMNRDSLAFPWQSNSNTSTTNVNSATINENRNTVLANLPTEVKGDSVATGTFTVAETALKVHSLQKAETYNGVTAEKDQALVVVFLEPIASAQVTAVSNAMSDAVKLVVSGKTSAPRLYKLASTQVTGDRGWVMFSVPETSTSGTLQVGSTMVELSWKK